MAIDSKHPLYIEFLQDWSTMRDAYRGERVVKSKGQEYLPATSGQLADGMTVNAPGYLAYQAYLTRALYPEFVSDAVEAMIGMMHHKPPTIELPKVMEPMREYATCKGESLEQLLRRINEAQLVTGRVGLLTDVPDGAGPDVLPYIATYQAESILNWDDGGRELVRQNLNLVVLDESEFERTQELEWQLVNKYRVLLLGDLSKNEPMGEGVYRVGVFARGAGFSAENLKEPSFRGATLNKLPFVFINTKDILPEPDDPPLLGLSKLALAVYRLEADYRQALFMQGQDTLVVIGSSDDSESRRVGANARIDLPTGGDAKYIGVNSAGLSEVRQALQNDRANAGQLSAKLVDSGGVGQQSGEALRIRVSAQTATLNQVALAGAGGLESMLKIIAEWMGADPEEVSVKPNLDFAAETLDGQSLVQYMTAKTMGAPWSLESIHELMRKKELTTKTFEEELEAVEEEGAGLAVGNEHMGEGEPEEVPVEE